jgi:hypothetical protein
MGLRATASLESRGRGAGCVNWKTGVQPHVGAMMDTEALSAYGADLPRLLLWVSSDLPCCDPLSDGASLTCCLFLCFLGHSRTLGSHLIPSPPKYPMTPDSGSISPRGSVDLPFRGRRLRGLGSLGPSLGEGPGLGERLAAVTSLRALEVSSGPSPRAQGCPDTKPAPAPAARPPGLHCLCHLNPIPSAHSQP